MRAGRVQFKRDKSNLIRVYWQEFSNPRLLTNIAPFESETTTIFFNPYFVYKLLKTKLDNARHIVNKSDRCDGARVVLIVKVSPNTEVPVTRPHHSGIGSLADVLGMQTVELRCFDNACKISRDGISVGIVVMLRVGIGENEIVGEIVTGIGTAAVIFIPSIFIAGGGNSVLTFTGSSAQDQTATLSITAARVILFIVTPFVIK